MSVIDAIQIDDLDEEQQQIAELIGIENYRKLVFTYGGVSIYIPKLDGFERAARDERIRKEFDGGNFRELAIKYGLTEVRIRSIVSDIVKEVRSRPMDGQIKFF